jgi:hypothetical protein
MPHAYAVQKISLASPRAVEGATSRVIEAPFQCEDRLARQIAVGMKKRWPEMSGYPRAHDPGSNRTLP